MTMLDHLAQIARTVRSYKERARTQAGLAREAQQLRSAAAMLALGKPDKPRAAQAAIDLAEAREARMDADAQRLLADWPATRQAHAGDGARQPAWPRYTDHGDLLEWLMLENLPGRFPYTAGASALERPAAGEDNAGPGQFGNGGVRIAMLDGLGPTILAMLDAVGGHSSAEAGADPASQLATTLANGFACVEACLARGLPIDDIAPFLSRSIGRRMDAGSAVRGRVARRIWSVAMRDRYGANERGQRLECHVQSSHRRLHALEDQRAAVIDGLTERLEETVLAAFDRLSECGCSSGFNGP